MADLGSLFQAIYGQESGSGRNPSTSVTGARGGMQIQPGTWAQYALPGENIDNPADNIAVGKRILADLNRKAGGDPARVAVGYFSGPGNIAPPGSPTPYLRNVSDPTGKTVASYANDIVKRMPSRPVTTTPGTTISGMPGPIDPSIIARGGVSPALAPVPAPAVAPAAPAAPVVPPQPTIGQQLAAGNFGGALQQAVTRPTSKPGDTATPQSPVEKIASSLFGGGQQQQQAPQAQAPALPPIQPAMDPMAGMAPAAQQLLTQLMAAQKPLTWSHRPYGAGAEPAAPGVTLNSSDSYV